MFDTYNRTSKEHVLVPYVKTVIITENKAPTDESIRILNEMQEKARLNIVNSVHINDNTVNGVVIAMQEGPSSINLIVYAKFKVNDKEFCFKKVIDRYEFQKLEIQYNQKTHLLKILYPYFVDEVSKVLQRELWGFSPDANIDQLIK